MLHDTFRSLLGLLLLCCCVIHCGCGDGRPERVKVSGTATFGGQDWPKSGLIYFAAIESAGNLPLHSGTAYFDTDGSYTAQTFDPGDGLIPGRYAIAVECWEVPPILGEGPPKSYVPQKFQHGSTSEIELVVERGTGSMNFDFDVPREHPSSAQ